MQTVRVTCPGCKVALNVSNLNNESSRLIVCPKCKTQLRVSFAPQQPADEGETVVGQAQRRSVRTYALQCNGQTYALADGLNTVGRKATTSKASIQIVTADQRMSRHHLQVQLMRLPGGVDRIKVSNWNNKNATWVGDILLADGESLFVEPGTTLRLGGTTLRLI